jgi:DHA2 family multidrug resistance protein-like MFS transporter
LGSIFAFRYHNVVGSALAVPASARAAVRNSIGTALDAARQLPAAQATAARNLARHGFVTAMRPTYLAAALVVLVAAFITWRFLPARAPDDAIAIVPQDAEVPGPEIVVAPEG